MVNNADLSYDMNYKECHEASPKLSKQPAINFCALGGKPCIYWALAWSLCSAGQIQCKTERCLIQQFKKSWLLKYVVISFGLISDRCLIFKQKTDVDVRVPAQNKKFILCTATDLLGDLEEVISFYCFLSS